MPKVGDKLAAGTLIERGPGTVQVSGRAISRYQERIENVPAEEVIRRIRSVRSWFGTGSGYTTIGPVAEVVYETEDRQIDFTKPLVALSVFPVQDGHITSALARGTWENHA
jgi:hypothetical protein